MKSWGFFFLDLGIRAFRKGGIRTGKEQRSTYQSIVSLASTLECRMFSRPGGVFRNMVRPFKSHSWAIQSQQESWEVHIAYHIATHEPSRNPAASGLFFFF